MCRAISNANALPTVRRTLYRVHLGVVAADTWGLVVGPPHILSAVAKVRPPTILLDINHVVSHVLPLGFRSS